mgnify:CR=1 FL=1
MAMLEYNPPTDPWVDIVFEDDHILAVNKPSGLLSVPGRAPEHHDSMWSRLQETYPEIQVVHRLDMCTSGLMVLALGKPMERELSILFQQRKVFKRYEAVVTGKLAEQTGEIDLPLITDWPNRPRQMVDHERGKSSQTRYQVMAYDAKDNASRMELEPLTGRTHQLRVHMLSIGHPLLGDQLYAHGEALDACPRLALHAARLGINHPETGERMIFDSPAPF